MTARLVDGLHGAFLLARGRADGMRLIVVPAEAEIAVATRSFWAIAFCLPGFIGLHLLEWTQGGPPAAPIVALVRDLLGYVIGWVGFAVLSHRLARTLGRGALWPRFITAWNWCNVVQYVIIVAAGLPDLAGLPSAVGDVAWLVGMGWALWLEWYATRLALVVPAMPAAALVGLDFALGVLLAAVTGA